MTEKELNATYYLNGQIERIKARISELEAEIIGSAGFDSMPKGNLPGAPTERIAMKKIALLEQLNMALERKIDAEIAARKFIDAVDDAEVQAIMEMRFLEHMQWSEIAQELSPRYKDLDRTTVAKKVRRYLKNL